MRARRDRAFRAQHARHVAPDPPGDAPELRQRQRGQIEARALGLAHGTRHGFVRVAAATPGVAVNDPACNADFTIELAERVARMVHDRAPSLDICVDAVRSPDMGAVCTFTGMVRREAGTGRERPTRQTGGAHEDKTRRPWRRRLSL